MDVGQLLSEDPPPRRRPEFVNGDMQQEAQRAHQYPTRQSIQSNTTMHDVQRYGTPHGSPPFAMRFPNSPESYSISPTKADPKNITFELLFNGDMRSRARLPMKVQIFPHDNTEGIVSTVKNFFGLYDEMLGGVSFEDAHGRTLIASYDNFASDMTVFVRVDPVPSHSWQEQGAAYATVESYGKPERQPHLDEGFQMPPPQSTSFGSHQISRPASRLARRQSTSPQLNGTQRSASIQKGRSRASGKRDNRDSRENSFHLGLEKINSDSFKEHHSSDGDAASVTSSFRARNEHLASAEISEANIVEGGRRQKAKFESSELPLFVPPQVPAPHSTSSISPQRRSNGNEGVSPFAYPSQSAFNGVQPLPSPQHGPYGLSVYPSIATRTSGQAHGHRLRDRVNNPSISTNFRGPLGPRASGFGILPTPDPTIASTISDEDVALQLMRLGDPANMSHGRTSASTMDDAFSGRADFASSATSDEDDECEGEHKFSNPQPQIKTPSSYVNKKRPASAAASDMSEEDKSHKGVQQVKRPKLAPSKTSGAQPRTNGPSKKINKMPKPRNLGTSKKSRLPTGSTTKVPISPASLSPQSRKGSTASLMGPPQLPFADDPDLSSKPRCQRCRKSKKGCDRQRPCQRCKDAGIGIEGCISEDEGNGRKGRFGRHMGVPVQLEEQGKPLITQSIENDDGTDLLDEMSAGSDKNKKRKR